MRAPPSGGAWGWKKRRLGRAAEEGDASAVMAVDGMRREDGERRDGAEWFSTQGNHRRDGVRNHILGACPRGVFRSQPQPPPNGGADRWSQHDKSSKAADSDVRAPGHRSVGRAGVVTSRATL